MDKEHIAPVDDWEAADGKEPRPLTVDVARVVRRFVGIAGEADGSPSVKLVAEKALTSTRTVYRCLAVTTETLSMSLGDRLCLAAGGNLSECRLVFNHETADEYVKGYLD